MLTAFYRDVYPRRAAQAAGCRCSFQCESAAVASSTCVFYPLRHAQYLLLLLLACAHPSRICCPVCARIHTCPPLLFSLSLSLPPFDRETCVFHAVSRVTMRSLPRGSSLHLAAGRGAPRARDREETAARGGRRSGGGGGRNGERGRRGDEGKRWVRVRVHQVYLCAAPSRGGRIVDCAAGTRRCW